MAQTKEGKKIVYVHSYTTKDGIKVDKHYRSVPEVKPDPKKPR